MKNQKGFSVLETFLIIVLIGIVGGTGWYVIRANKNIDKTNTDSTRNSVSAVNDKKASVTTPDPYEGWKTYSPTSFGASFKYPGVDWDFVAPLTCELNTMSATGQECAATFKWNNPGEKYSPTIQIERLGKSLEDVEKYYDSAYAQSALNNVDKETISLNGNKTVRYSVSNSGTTNIEYFIVAIDKIFHIEKVNIATKGITESEFSDVYAKFVASVNLVN